MIDMNFEKEMREQARWHILNTLNWGRPNPVNEDLVLKVLGDLALPFTPNGLRRELGYLEARELIKITRVAELDRWQAELTRIGIDMVEYTVPCDPGIARPVRR